MKLKVLRADPAGNITLFVLDPVPKGDRAALAARLMALHGSDVEQIGFVCSPLHDTAGRLEMAGGEFCGNAARAFGMLLASRQGGADQVQVEVSGCVRPVTVKIHWPRHAAQAEMPLPREVRPVQIGDRPGTVVDLTGIAHLVVEDVPPSLEFFQRAEPLFADISGLEAYGVIFLDRASGTMTPLVKVPAAGTLVWEGSCGSGSLAAAVAQSQNAPDGPFVRSYVQPAGTVEAAVVRRKGEVVSAYIGGPVILDPPGVVELSVI